MVFRSWFVAAITRVSECRVRAPPTEIMDGLSQQLLAGARLAMDDDRAVGPAHRLDLLERAPQRRARADDPPEMELITVVAVGSQVFDGMPSLEIGDLGN